MGVVVVIPADMDPVVRQRIEWGDLLGEAMEARKWTAKHLIQAVADTYGIVITPQKLTQWRKGQTTPRPDVQAALAGVFEIPHHMLFPPIKLERRKAA